MISQPTVLILGAGASLDYGFPLGRELRDGIVREIRAGNTQPDSFYSYLYQVTGGVNPQDRLKSFADDLAKSRAASVDKFLEHRSEYTDLGKAAIATALIPYEDPEALYEGWYEYLWERLLDGARRSDQFRQNNLAIVTFNYDRSLEAFLWDAMPVMYPEDAIALWEDRVIPIVHVHGTLGEYNPLLSVSGEYSTALTLDRIKKAIESIQIVSETDLHNPAVERANKLIGEAERVCFLGFGYHDDNLVKIIPGLSASPKDIYGTGVQMGRGIRNRVLDRLRGARQDEGWDHPHVEIDEEGREPLRYLQHTGFLI